MAGFAGRSPSGVPTFWKQPADQNVPAASAPINVSDVSASLLYRYRSVPNSEVIQPYTTIVIAIAPRALTPALVTDGDSVLVPGLAGGTAIGSYSSASASPLHRYRYTPYSEVIAPPRLVIAPAVVKYSYAVDASPLVKRKSFIPPMSVTVVIGTAWPNLSPPLVADVDAIFSSSIVSVQLLQSSVVNDTDGFLAPSTGTAATLSPTTFADVETTAVPSLVSTFTLQPLAFLDNDVFYTPLETNSVPIQSASFVDADNVLLAPTVVRGAVTLTPALVATDDQFFVPTLRLFLLPSAAVSDSDNVLAPSVKLVTQYLTTPVFSSDDIILQAGIGATGQLQPITTHLDVDNVLAPALQAGVITLQPIAAVSDSDTVGAATVTTQTSVKPNLVTDADNVLIAAAGVGVAILTPEVVPTDDLIRIPSVLPGSVTLFSTLHADNDNVPIGLVVRGANPLQTQVVIDDDNALGATVVASNVRELGPPCWDDNDVFYAAAVKGGLPTLKTGALTGSVTRQTLTGTLPGFPSSGGSGSGSGSSARKPAFAA